LRRSKLAKCPLASGNLSQIFALEEKPDQHVPTHPEIEVFQDDGKPRLSPEGKPLATILIPEKVANLTWAGADRRTLYITASTSVYRVQLAIPGLPVMHGH